MAKPMIGIGPSLKPKQKRGDGYFLYTSYTETFSSGAMPVILPFVATLDEARDVVARMDGLVLTGGGDVDPGRYGQSARHPGKIGPRRRDASDLFLARAAQERGTPTLGVCLGIQIMNVEFGGTLLQCIEEDLPGALQHEEAEGGHDAPDHLVAVEPGSLLARILGTETAMVNSYHHQSIDRVAPGFRVAARSPDGVIEAIERVDHPFYIGVQWHPERTPTTPLTRRLVGALVDAARGAPIKA